MKKSVSIPPALQLPALFIFFLAFTFSTDLHGDDFLQLSHYEIFSGWLSTNSLGSDDPDLDYTRYFEMSTCDLDIGRDWYLVGTGLAVSRLYKADRSYTSDSGTKSYASIGMDLYMLPLRLTLPLWIINAPEESDEGNEIGGLFIKAEYRWLYFGMDPSAPYDASEELDFFTSNFDTKLVLMLGGLFVYAGVNLDFDGGFQAQYSAGLGLEMLRSFTATRIRQ